MIIIKDYKEAKFRYQKTNYLSFRSFLISIQNFNHLWRHRLQIFYHNKDKENSTRVFLRFIIPYLKHQYRNMFSFWLHILIQSEINQVIQQMVKFY